MKKFVSVLILIIFFFSLAGILFHIAMFPERYISTWKYQLENEVKAGEPEALEYYQTVYLSRGIELFEM